MNKKYIIEDTSFFNIIIGILKFKVRLVLSLTRETRFISITPSFLKTQIIYDKFKKKYIKLYINTKIDYWTLHQVFISKDYSTDNIKKNKDILQFYKSILIKNKIPLIIDCGSNIGISAKFFSWIYPDAEIVCIEPNEKNIIMAEINNKNNQKVTFIKGAIGSEDGFGALVDPGLGNNAFRISMSNGLEVKVVSVNSLLKLYSHEKYTPFIIKIDIEGFEENLFRTGLEWIDKFQVIVIELHDWLFPGLANSRNFIKAISDRDRDLICINENLLSISNKIN